MAQARLLANLRADLLARQSERRKLQDATTRVTVIITTSPIPSNPCTMMIEEVVNSFKIVPHLADCRLIIVADGYTVGAEGAKFKPGRVSPKDSAAYEVYKEQLREKIQVPGNSLFGAEVFTLDKRHGFGFAIKEALRRVQTQFVFIQHHDQKFIRSFDMPKMVNIMASAPEKYRYLGVLSGSTLTYDELCITKYQLVLKPHIENGLKLLPLLYWYDRSHIANVQFYRDVVFKSGLVRRGTFIEDTYGQAQLKDIKEHGMQAHSKYGSWLMIGQEAETERQSAIFHINGRNYMTPEQRAEKGLPEWDGLCTSSALSCPNGS